MTNNLEKQVPNLATIRKTVEIIKELNPQCYITESMIRTAIKNKRLKVVMVGNRNLVRTEDVVELLTEFH